MEDSGAVLMGISNNPFLRAFEGRFTRPPTIPVPPKIRAAQTALGVPNAKLIGRSPVLELNTQTKKTKVREIPKCHDTSRQFQRFAVNVGLACVPPGNFRRLKRARRGADKCGDITRGSKRFEKVQNFWTFFLRSDLGSDVTERMVSASSRPG